MRRWRVGTISMGISIISLGCFLLFSIISGMQVFDSFTAWWPLIFIVLGIEILLYVSFSKQEHPIIKYDIFSIFFIGVLGTIGIALYLLLSTGLLEEIRYSISTNEQTNDIPDVQRSIPDTIKKIVVDTSNMPLTIEGTQSSELRLFGTYQIAMDKQEKNKLKQEDFVSICTIDQTMYVILKPLPITSKFFVSEPKITATLTLPQNIDVEIRESQRDITLYPGQLQSNWSIQGKSSVSVYLAKDSDMTLSAVTNKKELQGNMPWEHVEELSKNEDTQSREKQYEEQHEKWYKGTLKFGNGTHHLNVLHTYNLNVNVLEK